jgi:lantibiotic modifying enzyme
MPSRRLFIASSLVAATTRPALARTIRALGLRDDRPWLDAALGAERFIRRSRVTTGTGVAWPGDPLKAGSITSDLYNGMAGVIPFYLELWRVTGRDEYLHEAELGGRELMTRVGDDPGLYTGLAGTVWVIERTTALGGNRELAEHARRLGSDLVTRARPVGQGVQWNESTDIISGSSGIGLALLHLDRVLDMPGARDAAVKAGAHLLELGKPDSGGLTWLMTPTFKRNMPNFSHGTAGVGYFLARLHRVTGEDRFREGAEAAARYLMAISVERGDGRIIRHHDGDGENLFYLSWCHGPAGTARLFHELASQGNAAMGSWVPRLERGISAMGVPKRSPGFWENISQCCGNAGVIQFALDRKNLDYARTVTADLMARATRDGDALKWVQAENRVSPDQVVAQTGFMQGAAGVGTVLLHLDAAERGKAWDVTFPDSPWA